MIKTRDTVSFVIICALMVALAACEEDVVEQKPEERPSWSFESDSMNVGILVLKAVTYELLSGHVDHFTACESCDQDSLPMTVIYVPPMDVGSSTFIYTHTGDTLLYMRTYWSQPGGHIVYPTTFLPASDFKRLPWRFASPLSFDYFNVRGKTEPFTNADSAWARVTSLEVVGEFAKSDYRVGVFLCGGYEAEDYRWIIFLMRNG